MSVWSATRNPTFCCQLDDLSATHTSDLRPIHAATQLSEIGVSRQLDAEQPNIRIARYPPRTRQHCPLWPLWRKQWQLRQAYENHTCQPNVLSLSRIFRRTYERLRQIFGRKILSIFKVTKQIELRPF